MITTAVEAGVNYFDTAYIYPGSEATLGRALKKHGLRERVFIADKLPHFRCKRKGDFDGFLSKSLERLRTDYIDYYLIHNIGSVEAWRRLESLGIREWILEKKGAKAIRRIGFSFHGKSCDFVPLLDAYGWEFCLIQYNYMNENYQAGTAGLKAIHERGLPAMIMEPLLGGKLAQGLPRKATDMFDLTAPGRSPAEWALKWLWDKPEVTVVLSGMSTMEQLVENVMVAGNSPAGCLTDEERLLYKKVHDAIAEGYKVPCTGCDYCMPCPAGVNISGSLAAYNMSHMAGFMSALALYVNATMGFGAARSDPGRCTGCGICIEKCPQHIDIPARLKDARGRLEPFPIGLMLKAVKRIMG